MRKENQSRKLAALKKQWAKIGSASTSKKRESALQEANALLAKVSTGLAEKGKKNVNSEEADANIAEVYTLQTVGPALEPKVNLKRKTLHARIAKQGKFAHVSVALADKPKNMPKVTEQAN